MSDLFRRPWLLPMVQMLVSPAKTMKPIPARPVAQIRGVSIDGKRLLLSDVYACIWCSLTDACLRQLQTIRGSIGKLVGGLVTLSKYTLRLTTPAPDSSKTGTWSELTGQENGFQPDQLELELFIEGLEFIGGDDCSLQGEPIKCSGDHEVRHALEATPLGEMNQRLAYRQSVAKPTSSTAPSPGGVKWKPDWDLDSFCELAEQSRLERSMMTIQPSEPASLIEDDAGAPGEFTASAIPEEDRDEQSGPSTAATSTAGDSSQTGGTVLSPKVKFLPPQIQAPSPVAMRSRPSAIATVTSTTPAGAGAALVLPGVAGLQTPADKSTGSTQNEDDSNLVGNAQDSSMDESEDERNYIRGDIQVRSAIKATGASQTSSIAVKSPLPKQVKFETAKEEKPQSDQQRTPQQSAKSTQPSPLKASSSISAASAEFGTPSSSLVGTVGEEGGRETSSKKAILGENKTSAISESPPMSIFQSERWKNRTISFSPHVQMSSQTSMPSSTSSPSLNAKIGSAKKVKIMLETDGKDEQKEQSSTKGAPSESPHGASAKLDSEPQAEAASNTPSKKSSPTTTSANNKTPSKVTGQKQGVTPLSAHGKGEEHASASKSSAKSPNLSASSTAPSKVVSDAASPSGSTTIARTVVTSSSNPFVKKIAAKAATPPQTGKVSKDTVNSASLAAIPGNIVGKKNVSSTSTSPAAAKVNRAKSSEVENNVMEAQESSKSTSEGQQEEQTATEEVESLTSTTVTRSVAEVMTMMARSESFTAAVTTTPEPAQAEEPRQVVETESDNSSSEEGEESASTSQGKGLGLNALTIVGTGATESNKAVAKSRNEKKVIFGPFTQYDDDNGSDEDQEAKAKDAREEIEGNKNVKEAPSSHSVAENPSAAVNKEGESKSNLSKRKKTASFAPLTQAATGSESEEDEKGAVLEEAQPSGPPRRKQPGKKRVKLLGPATQAPNSSSSEAESEAEEGEEEKADIRPNPVPSASMATTVTNVSTMSTPQLQRAERKDVKEVMMAAQGGPRDLQSQGSTGSDDLVSSLEIAPPPLVSTFPQASSGRKSNKSDQLASKNVSLVFTSLPELSVNAKLEVNWVSEGGPASVAGIRVGDVIVSASGASTFAQIRAKLEGGPLPLTIVIRRPNSVDSSNILHQGAADEWVGQQFYEWWGGMRYRGVVFSAAAGVPNGEPVYTVRYNDGRTKEFPLSMIRRLVAGEFERKHAHVKKENGDPECVNAHATEDTAGSVSAGNTKKQAKFRVSIPPPESTTAPATAISNENIPLAATAQQQHKQQKRVLKRPTLSIFNEEDERAAAKLFGY